ECGHVQYSWVVGRVAYGADHRKSIILPRDLVLRARRRPRERQYRATPPCADSAARNRQDHYSLQNGLLLRNSASARVSPMSFNIRSSSAASSARSRVRRRHSPRLATAWSQASLSAETA